MKLEGQVAAPISAIVVGLVVLFVGLFMVDATAGTIPDSSIFGSTTITDSDNLTINVSESSANLHTFAVTTIVNNKDDEATISFTASNVTGAADSGSGNIGLTFNGNFVQNFSVPATEETFSATVTAISDVINNASYQTWAGNVTIISSSVNYLDSGTRTEFIGSAYDNIVNTTSTAMVIFGLILIIGGLVMAITSLRDISS